MYRLLDAAGEVKERRDQVRRPRYAAPELLATQPNEIWSWDITKLLGPVKWTYLYLYVILDIFSRYVVGWMIAPHESAALAERLIAETCAKYGIQPGQLTLHADRGGAMRSKPVALLLADLGVVKTHSRPVRVQRQPVFRIPVQNAEVLSPIPRPVRIDQRRTGVRPGVLSLVDQEHHHSGLGFLTPAVVHFGQAGTVRAHRDRVLAAAYAAHPERFVNGRPHPADLPNAVWINPPVKNTPAQDGPGATIARPDRPPHGRIVQATPQSTRIVIDGGAPLINSALVSQCH